MMSRCTEPLSVIEAVEQYLNQHTRLCDADALTRYSQDFMRFAGGFDPDLFMDSGIRDLAAHVRRTLHHVEALCDVVATLIDQSKNAWIYGWKTECELALPFLVISLQKALAAAAAVLYTAKGRGL